MRAPLTTAFITALVVVTMLWMTGAPLAAESEPRASSVTEDVLAAITLQGIRCDDLQSFEKKGENDYEVECSGGGRFRLAEINDKLLITNLLKDVAQAGVAGLEKLLSLPTQILSATPPVMPASVEMARGLFAIIRISGGDCDQILEVAEATETDHAVTCRNGTKHRIFTSKDGLVQVQNL